MADHYKAGMRRGGGGLSGAATRIPFFGSNGAPTSSGDFTYNDTTKTLTIKDFSIEGDGNVVALAAAERMLRIGCAAGTASFFLVANNTDRHEMDFQGFFKFGRRIQPKKGADIVAAGTLTLGGDGNVFHITGATTIDHITTSDWQAGSIVVLRFTGAPQVTHNAGSPPANTAAILLAGAGNFAASANDTLMLYYDGTNWVEIARTVI